MSLEGEDGEGRRNPISGLANMVGDGDDGDLLYLPMLLCKMRGKCVYPIPVIDSIASLVNRWLSQIWWLKCNCAGHHFKLDTT